MGIIIKETIKSSIISYIGVLIGFLNVGYLYDEILTKGEIGYIGITIAISEIFSNIFFKINVFININKSSLIIYI